MSNKITELEDLGLSRRTVLKATGVAGTTVVGAGALAGTAAADNINLKETSAEIILEGDDQGDLEVCFLATGLGDVSDIEATVQSPLVQACYACLNQGGNFPKDPKKQLEEQAVSETVNFPVKSGRVDECVVVDVPESTLRCPGNQNAVLVSVVYNDVTLTITTDQDSVTENLGDLSATFIEEISC